MNVLADHPELRAIWERHPDLGVRRLRSGKYWVCYELHPRQEIVLVLTVRHGRERVPELGEVR